MSSTSLKSACLNFFLNNENSRSRAQIVRNFIDFGVPRSTANKWYCDLVCDRENFLVNNAGRPQMKITSSIKKKILGMTENKVFPGYRAVGRKLNTDHHTAKKLVQKLAIVIKKRKKVPKVSPKQEATIVERLPKLSKQLNYRMVIMDDETYFDVSGHNFYGGQSYSSTDPDSCPDSIKYRFNEKFNKKLLVWAAISEFGISDLYYHQCSGAMNADIYIQECIKNRLRKFVQKHNCRTIFWPDLASSHYARKTLDTLEELQINYVSKDCNPHNVPQLRPIETFWSNLKAAVYSDGFAPENVEQLINKVKICVKKFKPDYFRRLMVKMKKKINLASENGLGYIRESL